ncbi:MAG: thioredoxin family protein [Bacteroidales bacterium]
MKKTLFLLLGLALIGCNAHSQKQGEGVVNWYTFEEAIELNKKEPRKIFIDLYTDWCSWCKVMDEKTFSHPDIAEYLNNNFYPVKFNAETDEKIEFQGRVFEKSGSGRRSPHDLAAALLQGKMSYPSVAYLDESSQLLTAVPGYMTPSQMEPILVFFGEDHYKTTGWEDFSNSFEGSINEE